MSSNIAKLGFQIDSTPITKAKTEIIELRKEGERAPKWMRAMATEAEKIASSFKFGNITQQTKATNDSLKSVGVSATQASVGTEKLQKKTQEKERQT